MVTKPGLLLASALIAAFGVGCTPSRVAQHWGEAQRELVARQVENPEAEQAPAEAVIGLDPVTGEAVMERYEREQSESKQPGSLPSIIQIDAGR